MKTVTYTKKKTRKRVIGLKTIIIGNTTMATMSITNTAARMVTTSMVTKTWVTTPMTITMETTNGNTA